MVFAGAEVFVNRETGLDFICEADDVVENLFAVCVEGWFVARLDGNVGVVGNDVLRFSFFDNLSAEFLKFHLFHLLLLQHFDRNDIVLVVQEAQRLAVDVVIDV